MQGGSVSKRNERKTREDSEGKRWVTLRIDRCGLEGFRQVGSRVLGAQGVDIGKKGK